MAMTNDPTQDPRYAAVAAQIANQTQAAFSNAALAKERAGQDLAYQRALLGIERPKAETSLKRSLLSRGILRSGEAQQKAGQLAADYMLRDQSLGQQYTDRASAADIQMQASLNDLAAREATERGDALSRLQQRAFDEEERARAARIADAALARDRAKAGEAAALVGVPTYSTGDEFARAAQEYAAALERNAAAAAAPAPAFRPAPRVYNPPRAPAPSRDASLVRRPTSGRY